MTVQDKLHSYSSIHIPTAPCIEQSLPHESCHQKEKLSDQTNSHPQINLIVKVSSEQVGKQNEPGKDKVSRKAAQKKKRRLKSRLLSKHNREKQEPVKLITRPLKLALNLIIRKNANKTPNDINKINSI